jgi:hypothetical protein
MVSFPRRKIYLDAHWIKVLIGLRVGLNDIKVR